MEPRSIHNIEMRPLGPPYYGEKAWNETTNGSETLEIVERSRKTDKIEVTIWCYPDTLRKYTLVEFGYSFYFTFLNGFQLNPKKIDIQRFSATFKQNYCLTNGYDTFHILVSHSREDILTMLDASPAYHYLQKKNDLVFTIFDKNTSPDSKTPIYGEDSVDLFDVTKPIVFDVDFNELCYLIKSIDDSRFD